ncbi:MAG: GGDEF domain-containing protein [Wenzhouxiangellaceae bacterium]|nr:MAG: GGDEF domain-containing protein [Wenzhouxiangellaceae bacterium]
MMSWIRFRKYLAVAALVPVVAWASGDLEGKLDQIRQLNYTGQIAQARLLLDQLAPTLRATSSAAVEHALLDAHNLALSGNLDAGLDSVSALLDIPLDDLTRTRALTLAANIAAANREHEQAFGFLRDALTMRDRIDDPRTLSQLFSNGAQMLAAAGEVQSALALGREAAQAAQASGIAREQCTAGQRLAWVKQLAGDLDAAAEASLAALAYCRQAGDRVFSATLALQKAELLESRGDRLAALEYLARSRQLFADAGYDRGLSIARLREAAILADQGHFEQALVLAEAQLPTLAQARLWDHLAEAHGLVASAARQLGQKSRALEHLDEKVIAEQRQHERERSHRLAYLQIALELDKHATRMAQLHQQARREALLRQSREQDSQLQRLSYLGAGLLGVILTLLVVQASRERRHYRQLARRDALTGLVNHSRFFERLDQAIKRSRARDQALTLVLGDIDHFKRVNDQHGHQTGDAVLRRVAARLQASFPSPAFCGRIGGEEFGIALPGLDTDQALKDIENLRQSINQQRRHDGTIRISMSFGLAQLRDGDQLLELRQRADEALYQAKREGRDRTVPARP